MAENRFRIAVTADESSATASMSKLERQLERFDKPLKKAKDGLNEVAKPSRFDVLQKGFKDANTAASGLADRLSGIVPQLGAIAGVSTAGGIVALGASFASAGADVLRSSRIIGVGTEELQRLRGAAKGANVPVEALDGALTGLGDTLQAARWGHNTTAILALRKLGLPIPSRQGPLDVRSWLSSISDAMSSRSPELQREIGQIFGVGAILPLVNQGSGHISALEAAYDRTAELMGGKALTNADRLNTSFINLQQSAQGTAYSIGNILGPSLEKGADAMSRYLQLSTETMNRLGGSALAKSGPRFSSPAMRRAAAQAHIDEMGIVASAPYDALTWGAGLVDKVIGTHLANDWLDWLAGDASPAGARSSAVAPAIPSDSGSVSDTMRALGMNRGAFLRDQLGDGGGVTGSVDVNVRISGAPPGTHTMVSSSGAVRARAETATEGFMPSHGP